MRGSIARAAQGEPSLVRAVAVRGDAPAAAQAKAQAAARQQPRRCTRTPRPRRQPTIACATTERQERSRQTAVKGQTPARVTADRVAGCTDTFHVHLRWADHAADTTGARV